MSRGVIPLLIAGALVAGSATVATAATTPTDLFVGGAGCSNTGPGSQSTPFCTIQAAAAVVLPGQTVHVATGEYNGPITITRSGEQGAPITFVKADGATNVLILPHGGVGFSVTAAHDVAISGFQVIDGAPAVAVSDSSRITVEHNLLTGDPTSTGGGVVVSGTSSDVTVSRNDVFGNRGDGVSVQSGVTGTTVITNAITDNTGTAVAVDDAPGTVITSNTAFFNCGTGIALTGASTGATIENNILDDDSTAAGPAFCGTVPAQSELTVAADATTGTTADYDIVFNSVNDFVYDWAGVARTSAATFTAATGQGAHDINANPRVTSNTGQVATTSPAIDSADSAAPGEQTVDELGNPRVDDPLVPNTGIGVADRGAVEVSDPFQVGGVTMSPTKAPVGASVTATVDVTDPWSTALSFSFDFGDGTAPVVTSAPSATHTYTSVGTHTVTVTGSTPAGVRQVRTTTVQTAPVAPLVANVRAYQTELLGVAVNTNASTDSWQITDSAIDFGDGTAVQHTAIGEASHTYAAPGRYTVTSTVTDFAGNTDVATQQVTVAGGYSALGPVRVLDTRDGTGGVRVAKLGAGGVVSLKLAGTHGIPATGVRAVVLNVTAVSPTAASFLTVYPDGTTRPVASSLNYVAGQTVPNLVTVPLGADGNVDFFNHVGTVDVVADLEGYYADRPPGGGEFLTALQDPERLLDTRDANSGTAGKPVGAGGIAQVSVRNVDPDAEETIGAVVVNVTVTASTTTSFLTVYPDGATRPTTSNLNFTTGQTISNLVTVPVLSDGVVDIFNHVGTAHVIVDLEGYYTHPFAFDPATAATSFTPLSPTRILDTRTTTGGHHAVIGPRGRATLQVAGMAGIPADATSVVLNVTGVSPTAATFVTAVPDGAFDPGTSDLNIAAGQTVPNMVVVPIASNGKIDFFNNAGQINVVADVTGYFAD